MLKHTDQLSNNFTFYILNFTFYSTYTTSPFRYSPSGW